MSDNKDTLKTIASLLPNGISEDGLKQISEVLDQVVDLRFKEQSDTLVTSFNAVLKQKINELKQLALEELLVENENIKAITGFNKILEVVAEYTDKTVLESVIKEKDDKIAQQEKLIKELETKLDTQIQETRKLETAGKLLLEDYRKTQKLLTEANACLTEDFESSEKAIVIHKNQDSLLESVKPVKKESSFKNNGNEFLTEETVRITENILKG